MALVELYQNIDMGVYGPDPEYLSLIRMSIREGTPCAVMEDFYRTIEERWAQFESDALEVLGVKGHPNAALMFDTAASLGGGKEDIMKTFAVLRRLAAIVVIDKINSDQGAEE